MAKAAGTVVLWRLHTPPLISCKDTSLSNIDHLFEQRNRALEQFAITDDTRPDAVSANFCKCGNLNCRCAHDEAGRHGHCHVRTLAFRERNRSVRRHYDEIALAQHQITEYRRCHAIRVAFVRSREELAEARRMALRSGDSPEKGLRESISPWRRLCGKEPDVA